MTKPSSDNAAEESDMDALLQRTLSKSGDGDSLSLKTRRSRLLVLVLGLVVLTLMLLARDEETFAVLESNNGVKALTGHQLLRLITKAKDRMDELNRQDYGSYAQSVFDHESIYSSFRPGGKASVERMKRRMLIKILEAQLHIAANHGKEEEGEEEDEKTTNTPLGATFTWVTAGHSAAAGHGNFFNQTYTAVLESAAQDAFNSLGIRFRAKNYAQGASSSGPELSLCMSAILGTDIDVAWWDYGMTEAGATSAWLYALWANRVGSHPSSPTMLTFDDRSRNKQNELFDGLGLATFTFRYAELRKKFPDSDKHPNPQTLPPAVRYYMCAGFAEQNDCADFKWNTPPPCEKIKYQVNWHNGWKDHMFIGRLQAMFLIYVLEEAIADFVDRIEFSHQNRTDHGRRDLELVLPSVSKEYLNHLRSEEKADHEIFQSTPTPSGETFEAPLGSFDQEDWPFLFRSPTVCHSARLPSQARYDGLLAGEKTQNNNHHQHSHYLYAGKVERYQKGVDPEHFPKPQPNNPSTPPILTTRPDKVKSFKDMNLKECQRVSEIDRHDMFVVREEDGWMADIYPTKAEANALGNDLGVKKQEGIIILCTQGCPFNQCEDSDVGVDELLAPVNGTEKDINITISVDGQPVLGVKRVGNYYDRCNALVGKNGKIRWRPKHKTGKIGQFELKFRVHRPKGRLYLSSIIVL